MRIITHPIRRYEDSRQLLIFFLLWWRESLINVIIAKKICSFTIHWHLNGANYEAYKRWTNNTQFDAFNLANVQWLNWVKKKNWKKKLNNIEWKSNAIQCVLVSFVLCVCGTLFVIHICWWILCLFHVYGSFLGLIIKKKTFWKRKSFFRTFFSLNKMRYMNMKIKRS